ncbi:hypothetical protein ACEWY4_002290 [Coilia grayii]|uniref:YY1-associated factor 2 n=1 Tax=Coilia grayii TaxID=363190 RepID=A0ABD1KVF2_9TELE
MSFPRKPRPVSQLVAQQVTQQFAPTQPKKERRERTDKELSLKKNTHKKMRPRLKNVDRSSAQHLEVTVGDLTVIITDFKEKAKPTSSSSSANADQLSQSGSGSDNNAERAAPRPASRPASRPVSRSSSPRPEASCLNGESH